MVVAWVANVCCYVQDHLAEHNHWGVGGKPPGTCAAFVNLCNVEGSLRDIALQG